MDLVAMKHLLNRNKCRTPNEHIGSMAAVSPLENMCGNERLSPAGSVVEAATSQSRWALCASGARNCNHKKISNLTDKLRSVF